MSTRKAEGEAEDRAAYDLFVLPTGMGLAVVRGGAVSALWLLTDRQRAEAEQRKRFPAAVADPEAEPLSELRRQLGEYFAGERRRFELPLAPEGTGFELRVWDELLAIPYGETRSYAQVAAALGSPAACRAVGRANGRNPISIVIPCHRVIGSDGSLTGYGGGLPVKRLLLELEGAAAVGRPAAERAERAERGGGARGRSSPRGHSPDLQLPLPWEGGRG